MTELTDRQARIRREYIEAALEYANGPVPTEHGSELDFRATVFAKAIDQVLEERDQ